MRALRSLAPFFVFAAGYAAIALIVTNSYYQSMLTLVLVWASFGLSWNVLSGYTGLVSFGHAAFFGIGAYTTALGQIHLDLSPWLLIPAAAAFGALAGLLIGFPTFRLRGVYFALAMLAYPLALLYVFEWLGYQEVTLPMKRETPAAYMQFADQRINTLLALFLLTTMVFVTRMVEQSRFGMALLAIKQNEAAAQAAGIDTIKWKLRAITLSGAMASAVGAFYAVVLLVVTPVSVFGMLVSAQALTVTLFGGVGTVWGPVIGAAILIPTAETLHAELGHLVPGIQNVIYGLAIVILILAAPEGAFWKARDLAWRRWPKLLADGVASSNLPGREECGVPGGQRARSHPHLPTSHSHAPAAAPVPLLSVGGLSKSFGGLRAVRDVSFDVPAGTILGIIGPNGAGKTTIFNLLNGFLLPDGGQVLLDGRNLVGRRPHEVCAAGVGRTFQVMRPFARMSVADNVLIGAYIHAPTDDEARALAADAVGRVGLAHSAGRLASELTTRELRLMELARALAGQPRILLLDETLAGLGHGEADEMVGVVRSLAQDGLTIIIIEHTMKAMVRLVDRFVVLDRGAVLMEGSPEAVTRDPRVVEAYLGKKWAAYAQS
ncbi:MAG: branched-chain amino acid ABC transporter ATP-binding protein/permease [Hyphomicrobiaceae bacterium]|nr:branched-chain amino acid ABC transporter ATP-binding protein/permease [Hyphomicrobiaceae bacterium]